jgi:hypothetical protein
LNRLSEAASLRRWAGEIVRGLYGAFLIRRRSIVTISKPCSFDTGGASGGVDALGDIADGGVDDD